MKRYLSSIIFAACGLVYIGFSYWMKQDTEVAALTFWAILMALGIGHLCMAFYHLLPARSQVALKAVFLKGKRVPQ